MTPGTTVVVGVVDASGAPRRCKVSVTDGNGHQHVGLMGMSGIAAVFGGGESATEHRVGPLAAGSYLVLVETADGQQFDRPLGLDGQPEERVEFVIGE